MAVYVAMYSTDTVDAGVFIDAILVTVKLGWHDRSQGCDIG